MSYFKQEFKLFLLKFTGNYITNKPVGSIEDYKKIYQRVINYKYPEIDQYLKSFKEIDKEWLNNLALHTQITIKKSKINIQHGRLLYAILNKYIETHKGEVTILETGTARGFSSIVMSKVFNEWNRNNFKIYTIDFTPHTKKIYWNSLSDVYGKKSRVELLEKWKDLLKNIIFLTGKTKKKLKELKHLERIHFSFLDASHDYISVKREFDFISKRQKKGDIIILDDVTEDKFNGIVKLVNEVQSQGNYTVSKLNSEKNRGYAICKKN